MKVGYECKQCSFGACSLWVQIWGVPFDMMSLNVATEVGNKMGMVEDVERRWRTNDQNFFLRVRVALPISKPLRRGGFLLGSDGKHHWLTYKYKRLPFFCHYYGVLGHDIRHCSVHFEASKKDTLVEYQYGDWLKVDNGRSKSPPRWGKDSPMKSKPTGRIDVTATKSDERLKVVTAAARVPDYRARRKIQNGNHEVGGNGPKIQKKNLGS